MAVTDYRRMTGKELREIERTDPDEYARIKRKMENFDGPAEQQRRADIEESNRRSQERRAKEATAKPNGDGKAANDHEAKPRKKGPDPADLGRDGVFLPSLTDAHRGFRSRMMRRSSKRAPRRDFRRRVRNKRNHLRARLRRQQSHHAAFAFACLKPRHFGKIFGANAGRYWIVTYSLESALVTSTGRSTLT
jgi:hypothetical protein